MITIDVHERKNDYDDVDSACRTKALKAAAKPESGHHAFKYESEGRCSFKSDLKREGIDSARRI